MIYLDHNATTPLSPEARAAMEPFLAERFGNASSAHAAGSRARAAVEQARREAAAAVEAKPAEVFFTSGGTESNNWAVLGSVGEPRGSHLVVSPIEHSSVIAAARELERRGARITWLPVDGEGRVDPADVDSAIRPDTVLVSVGWANGEIGTVQPIAEIGAVCRSRGVRFHADAVQALGKLPVDAREVDLCSLSAHKIGGPKGTGTLIVRRGVELRPLLFGGSQERGARPGTENVAGIAGFGAAARAVGGMDVRALRDRLWRGLSALGARRHGPPDGLPNTLNVAFAGVRGEALVAALDLEGVCASVGSACAAGSAEPSHVLLAIGCSEEESRAGLRFSLGPQTTEAEIDAALAAAETVLGRMRRPDARRAAVA